ncbi:MAG: cyclic nucleotide-binding domain-containing protein [Myxococcota bacterium]
MSLMEASSPSSSLALGESIVGVAFLQSTSLCKDLPDAVMSLLYEQSSLVEYQPSDIVIAQGAADYDLFVVVEGDVTVQKLVDGEWVHLADLERPAVFGEVAALTGQPRAAAVVSTTDCKLVRIPGDTVRAVADAAPKFGKRLAMLMSARSRDTEKKTSG